MGYGNFSSSAYDAAAAARRINGQSDFGYSDATLRRPRDQWKVHDLLNPFGVTWREACDSAEHPLSTPIAVFFDVTGSMGRIPKVLQTKLALLLGLLTRNGYVPDPQILFGAIGDATCDTVPLQASQFESDNRLDDALRNIILEGGGGGQMRETYELALYFMEQHTRHDRLDQRGRKGYLFLIGDEMAYPTVRREHVKQLIGDDLEDDIPTKTIVERASKLYDIFFLYVNSGTYLGYEDEIFKSWQKLLGERAIKLNDPDAVAETVAGIIGLCEGTASTITLSRDLVDLGTSTAVVNTVTTALAKVGSSGLARIEGNLPTTNNRGRGATRI